MEDLAKFEGRERWSTGKKLLHWQKEGAMPAPPNRTQFPVRVLMESLSGLNAYEHLSEPPA